MKTCLQTPHLQWHPSCWSSDPSTVNVGLSGRLLGVARPGSVSTAPPLLSKLHNAKCAMPSISIDPLCKHVFPIRVACEYANQRLRLKVAAGNQGTTIRFFLLKHTVAVAPA